MKLPFQQAITTKFSLAILCNSIQFGLIFVFFMAFFLRLPRKGLLRVIMVSVSITFSTLTFPSIFFETIQYCTYEWIRYESYRRYQYPSTYERNEISITKEPFPLRLFVLQTVIIKIDKRGMRQSYTILHVCVFH